jgi:hypothetical protein
MEKRSNPRRQINTTIICHYFNGMNTSETFDGNMKNCCIAGFYAEMKRHFKPGTILVVRATGKSGGYSIDEGFRSQALAEVKWSNPKNVKGDGFYATGLKYLMAY